MMEKMETKTQKKSGITRRKSTQYVKFCAKDERNASLKKVSTILQKAENDRTLEEQQVLCEYSEIVADLKLRWHRRDEAKRRVEEVEEPVDVLDEKCKILAQALAQSEHLVVYTGAGISTAARIPDYRGTNGIWTRLQQGKEIGNHDLSLAEPTFTHMALSQLYHQKRLKYVVSQNCDGLHLRSGLPRSALSELHGNMYVEVCKKCQPVREYWRLFDVTENTARFSHKTMRRCYVCSSELVDTIVHFGERGTLQWPLNWPGACKNADVADTILCLGSSLKVLKRYPWLWQMNKPAKKRPNLYIVNLQWTPKDDCAVMKINGKCDEVMTRVMKLLGVDVAEYNREKDPIFAHSTPLCELELHTTNQPALKSIELKSEVKSETKSEVKSETKSEVTTETSNEDKTEVKQEITEAVKCETVENVKEEKRENFGELNNSINFFQEQNEAVDLTVRVKRNEKSDSCDNNTLNNTHTSVKSARISQNNGASSINCTLSNKEQINVELPKRKSHSSEKLTSPSVFSIDSILNKNDTVTKQTINVANNSGHNLQTIMAYYEFANSLLQNQMLNYLTSGLYPFQTSFMYPGLHSIINPMPYFNYDFDCSVAEKSNNSTVNLVKKIETPIVKKPSVPACVFCHKTFESYVCLYYQTTEPIFKKQLYRFSKLKNCNKELVCVCCDYTTEEDSESESEKTEKCKKKLKRNSKSEEAEENECVSENVDETNICEDQKKVEKALERPSDKPAKVQAGWFGKGYRKNRKPRKKQYSNSR